MGWGAAADSRTLGRSWSVARTAITDRGCRWTRSARGDESVLGGRLGMLLVIVFFQELIGACREESVGQLCRHDRGDRVAILGAQAAQHVQHLTHLTHWLSDITKSVGELLEPAGVLGDAHVALDKIVELGL